MANNEFGDFQTPLALAKRCLEVLNISSDARVLEPTCGVGAFLQAAQELAPDSERVGLEINEAYAAEAGQWGRVTQANVFDNHVGKTLSWDTDGPLFVVGNPPWVNSADLARMESGNIPKKENFKGAKGLDAMLGGSNFDVCEYIILKMLKELAGQTFRLGMLCKTQVARNVIEHAHQVGIKINGSGIYPIDAKKWFNAGVDACFFVVSVDPHAPASYHANIYGDLFDPGENPAKALGVVDGVMVSNVQRYAEVRQADGTSPYTWRSGLKHDASKVFELKAAPEPTTKAGEVLDIEEQYLYPFLKSTDIFRGRHRELTKWVIVPQMKFGENTNHLEHTAPRLWSYLTRNAEVVDGRKSSIYRNRPRFSVFGHGDYTFAPYKVVVSGLHKEPRFRLVAPLADKPVVMDDTCYLLPFEDGTEAAMVTGVLQAQPCVDLIESLVFWDSKRPITKKLLARLDLNRLQIDVDEVLGQALTVATEAGIEFDPTRAADMPGRFGQLNQEPQNVLF
ncbi:SAM-dependent DNA methyltransferase [Corynebacterium qintianiae]|uniref:SAM-dependent DNA methyltransferase n=1 Tax=Corynebacterium qintianiae TaxID=2709392 RepID=UPI0013EA4A07|nr:SAM-dependent DNA methyltransferase [Corynebacterium qintianiae]